MLVLCQDDEGRWSDVRVEDASSVLAQVPEPPTNMQMTCVAFRVPVTKKSIVVLLPVPSSACLVAADLNVLEFISDILHCFPSTVKPVRRTTFDSDSESDDETDRLTKKHKKATQDQERPTLGAPNDYFAAWSVARVRLVNGDDVATSLAHLSLPGDLIASHVTFEQAYVVAELPPTTQSTEGIPNAGFLLTHPMATPGFLASFAQRCIDEHEPAIMWKQSVLTFNGQRELSENGAGKTSSEMLDNIRRRHASGTFTKLVFPTTTWSDVAAKYVASFPWIRGIHGDLRMRKIMEVLPTEPVRIRLNGN